MVPDERVWLKSLITRCQVGQARLKHMGSSGYRTERVVYEGDSSVAGSCSDCSAARPQVWLKHLPVMPKDDMWCWMLWHRMAVCPCT